MQALRIKIFIAVFCISHISTGQPYSTREYIRSKMDSAAWFLSSNMADLTGEQCRADGHEEYMEKTSNFYFSEGAFIKDKQKKEAYLRIYELIYLAGESFDKKDYSAAISYWGAALPIAIQYDFSFEELHKIRPALNNNYFLAGDYTNAMKMSSAALARSERIKDTNRIVHFNNVIGYIYMKLGDTAKAGVYYNNHLENARNMNDSFEVAHALYNLGDLAITRKDYDQAIDHFTRSLNCYAAIRRPGRFDHFERKGFVSNKLAQSWKLKGDLAHAMEFIRISLLAADTAKGVNEYDKAEYFVNAGDIYNRLNKPDSALILLQKGLKIATYINHREFKRDAFEQIAISFSQQKKFDSAYIYQNRFSLLRDSIDNEVSREEIYQRDADLQIERQQQLQKAALQRQRTWRNIIIGVAAFLLLTIGFLYNRYRLKQKNRYQKELNRQQIELFNAIAATQEQERKRIAQDIHDSLGSILSAAKLKMAEVKDSKPELVDEKFISGINLLDEASSELRNISHNIMPATLSKLGLVPALKNLAEKISTNKGLQVHFIAHELHNRLDEQTEISVYRIILELINNVVKHAAATKATVQLIKYPDYINITIEDNGKGFDIVKTNEDKMGMGLGNVAARVEYLKGKLDIDSMPGKGTTIVVDIPFFS